MPALGSSSFKYVTAIFGLHARSKAVGFGSFSLFRLISSLWHKSVIIYREIIQR